MTAAPGPPDEDAGEPAGSRSGDPLRDILLLIGSMVVIAPIAVIALIIAFPCLVR